MVAACQMRKNNKQQLKQLNAGAHECTFLELDRAVYEDLHAVLSRLTSDENENNVWIELERIFHDCCNALEYLGSNAVTDEIRHAYGAYRCFAALVTESNLLQEYGIDRGDSFLASLIAEDQDFRLVYVLWRWCHDGATDSKGFGELAYQIMDIKELSSLSRSYINRTVKGKKVGIDPDSMLSAPEDANFEKLIRVMFSLLRCGRFEEAMKLSGDMSARLNAALGIEHPIFAPTTVEGIFEAVATSEPSPYYVLMSFMIRGAWDEAVNWMYSYCINLEKKPGSDPQSLYRFFGLVTSVFRVLKYDHDEDHGKNLVGRMIDVLLQKELFSLIPLYASLLPNDDALKAIWNVMPYVKSDGDRISFIAALNDAGFDGEQIAFEFGRFRVVEMVDHAGHLRWIYACDDKKLVNAVTETNNVLRHYLLSEMEDEASALIDQCEKLKLVDRLAALVKNENSEPRPQWVTTAGIVIDEFNNHCLYLTARTNATNFAVECARAQEIARRKAMDDRECEEWPRESDLVGLSQRRARVERNQALQERSKLALDACKARTLDAITAFVRHPGWRSETKADWGRCEQLKSLRERCYANMLNMLLRDLGMCDDAETILDVLTELADEELELYKDLSVDDLSRFLLDVHTLAGHALG
ncbi:Nuclear pore complex protein [Trichostrongylus colubriformis]|uniref:Nuclear pore complex protein n=1 Tax=Trichostrongylus colubriformis TaxID=6319 RepID=A0AAN8IKR8_TRICO